MRFNNVNITINANKDELLSKLRANREKHAGIVAEARKGYVQQAEQSLKSKLEEIKLGKIVNLTFSLSPPIDCTEVYDTVISMLEMHRGGDNISMESGEYRNLIMDEWDWSREFYGINKRYSVSATSIADSKGY